MCCSGYRDGAMAATDGLGGSDTTACGGPGKKAMEGTWPLALRSDEALAVWCRGGRRPVATGFWVGAVTGTTPPRRLLPRSSDVPLGSWLWVLLIMHVRVL